MYFLWRLSNALMVPSKMSTIRLFTAGFSIRPRRILDTAASLDVEGRYYHLIGVADDRQDGIVRDYDDLPSLLGLSDSGDQQLCNRFVVEVVLRLIHEKGLVVPVYQEIEDDQQRTSFAR